MLVSYSHENRVLSTGLSMLTPTAGAASLGGAGCEDIAFTAQAAKNTQLKKKIQGCSRKYNDC